LPQTLYDKLWESHLLRTESDGAGLIYVDRHLLHEVSTPQSFITLEKAGHSARRPSSTLAVCDHAVPTLERHLPIADLQARNQVARLKQNTTAFGIPYIDLQDHRQGIVHVIGPELGFTLPGATLACSDSHTSTHGAFGALAFGVGASECAVILATQCLWQHKSKRMRVNLEGRMHPLVAAKDLALATIAAIRADGASGYAIEYAGSTVDSMTMEGRMTLCNMSIEAGARVGMVAPDETTFAYLLGRPMAPKGEMWDQAVAYWRTLKSDPNVVFDREVHIDAAKLAPHVTWGTSPQDAAPIDSTIPDPESFTDPAQRKRVSQALAYMGLEPGSRLDEIAIDKVFIGSCTNGRIEDLRAAAAITQGKHVARGVTALVVPGSTQVKHQAEAEGLDRIFLDAGWQWREAGCSLCVAINNDRLADGERCASTSNRNFEGRQGAGSRTHLLSPAMAAAAAVTGHLVDVRTLAS
jgi:3-isopropylmalate/(R)-2-methylmalate dehydratase large subunit